MKLDHHLLCFLVFVHAPVVVVVAIAAEELCTRPIGRLDGQPFLFRVSYEKEAVLPF